MGLGSFLRGLLPGAGSPSGAAPRAAALAPRASGSWRTLPPIQRSVGSAPLVAPTPPFKAGLAAARPAPTALAPLRHDRGLHAPSGLVSGLATPVQRATEPVPASVRRPVAAGRERAPGNLAQPEPWPLSDTTGGSAAVWPAFGSSAGDSDSAPLLHAPAVAPTSGPSSLTVAPLAISTPGGRVGGRPTVAREAEHQAGPAVPVGPVAPRADQPTVARTVAAPLGTGTAGRVPAAATAAGGPSQDAAAAGTAPATHVAALRPEAARPNLGQSRRLRVGAALTPTSAGPLALQRSATGSAPDGAGAHVELPPLPGSVRAVGLGQPAAAGLGLPVSREVDGSPVGAGEVTPTAVSAPASGPAAGDPAESAVAVPLRPLGAARPAGAPLVGTLQPLIGPHSPAVAVHVQAEAADEPVEEPGTPAAALAALAQIDGSAGIGPAAGGLGAPSALFPRSGGPGQVVPGGGRGAAGGPTVARSAASSGLSDAGAVGALSRTAPAFPGTTGGRAAIQRSVATAAPVLQRTMTWDPVNGMATATGPAPDLASGPGFAAATTVTASGTAIPALPAIAPLVARSFDPGEDHTFAPVQREEAAAAPAGDGGGTAAAASGAGGAMPEAQLDDLARRLHDRIAARLSRDLLIERERSGSLIDRGW